MSEQPHETPEVEGVEVSLPLTAFAHPRFERPLEVRVREARLLTQKPWTRPLGNLVPEVRTEGWRFPLPVEQPAPPPEETPLPRESAAANPGEKRKTRLRPPADTVVFKDRLLYLLQPPLEDLFAGREVELPFKPYPYQVAGIAFLMPRHAALIADEMGLGKAQPLDARILTPTGWKRMGEMAMGDRVVNSAGGASTVTGVYPQGEREVFRVEFSDGAFTECCDDHLWQVHASPRRSRGIPPRVLPLRAIRATLTQPNGDHNHFVPLVGPVAFDEKELPIDPYLLGALLGSGDLAGRSVRFAAKEPEVLDLLRPVLPEGVRLVHGQGRNWTLTGPGRLIPNPLITRLRELGLRGARAETKFIPQAYKFSSVSSRMALLQGLLDSAGLVDDELTELGTVSARLAQDLRFLTQSLGGTARVRTKVAAGQIAYRVRVVLPDAVASSRLPRKARGDRRRGKASPARAIVGVASMGRKPVQCIAVDAPDQLYVTDDCILTHNTMQTIVSIRLMLHAGLLRSALVVCPKPLVINWSRELRTWAPDLPFEVLGGDTHARRRMWQVSNCPVKLVNYELLTRDEDIVAEEGVGFDLVVLDEAQRIKNRDSKTAQVVRSLRRQRSWAMTGTPIENRFEDLVNIFAFVDPDRIPPETPARQLPDLTSDCIIRRTKEEVATDMPPRIIRESHVELCPAQRDSYDLAEKEGVIHLNALGDTITVQHVFELVMRLKQICNFDPRTGDSAKVEQLVADMEEVAENGQKAIVFSQWVAPLEKLAGILRAYGPLLYHGKVAHGERQGILDRFKADPTRHVLLMSYGTGSVGLNLQFCNYVFLFDRWWNPAVEDQAINRAHRLGQKAPVFVTRFISADTIEGRIHEILEAKRQLFQELIEQNGPPPCMGLTEDEVFGLFNIRGRPRRAA